MSFIRVFLDTVQNSELRLWKSFQKTKKNWYVGDYWYEHTKNFA